MSILWGVPVVKVRQIRPQHWNSHPDQFTVVRRDVAWLTCTDEGGRRPCNNHCGKRKTIHKSSLAVKDLESILAFSLQFRQRAGVYLCFLKTKHRKLPNIGCLGLELLFLSNHWCLIFTGVISKVWNSGFATALARVVGKH